MKRNKLWVFLAAAALILGCNYVFGWSAYLTGSEVLYALRTLLEENMGQALALYFLLTVVGCVLLALPGVTFAIAAGLLFGPLWGTLACWLATAAGACLSFLTGRYFLKDVLKPRLENNRYLKRLLFEGAGRSDVYLLAVTRLVPLFPFNLQNFAYGITDIRFLSYALYSAIFMLPGTAAYTVGAAGILNPGKRLPLLLLAGVLLVGVLLISRRLKRSVAEE